ncbi:hypothetical protein B6U99_06915 [Candidatus Geothermarchaeota archaeon ex4572_27]|nr:MAG: hypothetical protein B6U99_06915 [Candidatus Geothermarchaeota archaeon ex4572_27]
MSRIELEEGLEDRVARLEAGLRRLEERQARLDEFMAVARGRVEAVERGVQEALSSLAREVKGLEARLREALAEAVRSEVAKLLDSRLSTLEGSVRELRGALKALELRLGGPSEVEGELRELRGEVEALGGPVREAVSGLEALRREVSELREAVKLLEAGGLEEAVKALERAVSGLREALAEARRLEALARSLRPARRRPSDQAWVLP